MPSYRKLNKFMQTFQLNTNLYKSIQTDNIICNRSFYPESMASSKRTLLLRSKTDHPNLIHIHNILPHGLGGRLFHQRLHGFRRTIAPLVQARSLSTPHHRHTDTVGDRRVHINPYTSGEVMNPYTSDRNRYKSTTILHKSIQARTDQPDSNTSPYKSNSNLYKSTTQAHESDTKVYKPTDARCKPVHMYRYYTLGIYAMYICGQ